MDSEAPSSSTDLSKINATAAHKKRGGRKARRCRRQRRANGHDVATPEPPSTHADIQPSLHTVDRKNSGMSLVGGGIEVEFVDEEAMFNMPLLLDCMAQGMLLTPPALKKGFTWTDEYDHHIDFTLWTD